MTQCEKILRYMRLGARIFDLKAQGIPIKTEMVKRKNRFGEPVSFARYSIIKGAQ